MTTSLLKFSSCLRSSNPTSDRTGWAPPGVGIKSSKSIYKAFQSNGTRQFFQGDWRGAQCSANPGIKKEHCFLGFYFDFIVSFGSGITVVIDLSGRNSAFEYSQTPMFTCGLCVFQDRSLRKSSESYE